MLLVKHELLVTYFHLTWHMVSFHFLAFLWMNKAMWWVLAHALWETWSMLFQSINCWCKSVQRSLFALTQWLATFDVVAFSVLTYKGWPILPTNAKQHVVLSCWDWGGGGEEYLLLQHDEAYPNATVHVCWYKCQLYFLRNDSNILIFFFTFNVLVVN